MQADILQVGVASLIDPGSKIQVCKVDVSKRASCGDLLGNTLPCPVSPGYRGTSHSCAGFSITECQHHFPRLKVAMLIYFVELFYFLSLSSLTVMMSTATQ